MARRHRARSGGIRGTAPRVGRDGRPTGRAPARQALTKRPKSEFALDSVGGLALDEPPTAVFAASDMMAMGAMRAVQAAGLSVPGDIAVVGFDDIDVAGMAH